MKRLILSLTAFIYSITLHAQAPQAINYQAVARNGVGQIVPSQNIGVRFSILDGSASGTLLYQETYTTTTNNFGLFTLAIGKGTVSTGVFSNINWGGTDKYLKVEIAPQGGTTYLLQGTTQLLSVPYALYSEKTRLLAGNNTINITNGNTISGNYQAGNNTILVTGNSITGNYQAANNTILLTGNTIAANYQAGTGISISGNTITNTVAASSLWVADANGQHSVVENVGVGANSVSNVRLTINQVPTGGFSGALDITSNDTYQTVVRYRNQTVPQEWQMMVAGTINPFQQAGSFALYNNRLNNWVFNTDPTNSYLAVGSPGNTTQVPKSRLHVFAGDVNINDIGSGIILKSPNGQCWRITIDNAGNLVRTAITCP